MNKEQSSSAVWQSAPNSYSIASGSFSRIGPNRMRRRQVRGNGDGVGVARRMAKAAGAHRMSVRVGRKVIDDVVVVGRADPGRHIVEIQGVTDLPGDDVVGAGGIPAHAQAAHDLALLVVEGQAAAKHVHAANL